MSDVESTAPDDGNRKDTEVEPQAEQLYKLHVNMKRKREEIKKNKESIIQYMSQTKKTELRAGDNSVIKLVVNKKKKAVGKKELYEIIQNVAGKDVMDEIKERVEKAKGDFQNKKTLKICTLD